MAEPNATPPKGDHKNAGLPAPPPFHSKEEHDMIDHLIDNLKVIRVPNCKIHPDREFCDCAVALHCHPIALKLNIRATFIFHWEILILNHPHAYEYDGTQASHHAFAKANGDTPKHFARTYLQSGMPKEMFVPAKRQADLIQAMLAVWRMRTKQWKVKYSSQKGAAGYWARDEYPEQAKKFFIMPPSVSEAGLDKGRDYHAMMSMQEVLMGPPWHRVTVWLCYLGKRSEGEGAVVEAVCAREINLCHEDCERGARDCR